MKNLRYLAALALCVATAGLIGPGAALATASKAPAKPVPAGFHW